MIAMQMKLTPAQVRLLLTMYAERWDGPGLLPERTSGGVDTFLTTAGSLIRRGLVSHDENRAPPYVLTTGGRGVAIMMMDQMAELQALMEGREERLADMPERCANALRTYYLKKKDPYAYCHYLKVEPTR